MTASLNTMSLNAADAAVTLQRLLWNWLPARYSHPSHLWGFDQYCVPGSRVERAMSGRLLRQRALETCWLRTDLPYAWLLESADALNTRAYEIGLASHSAYFSRLLTRQSRQYLKLHLGDEHYMRSLDYANRFPQLAALGRTVDLGQNTRADLLAAGAGLMATLLGESDGVAQRFLLRFSNSTSFCPIPLEPLAKEQMLALLGAFTVVHEPRFDWSWGRHDLVNVTLGDKL